MQRFEEGDRVRVDIPNEADPDHDNFHGEHGTIVAVRADDAGFETGDARDRVLYSVEFDDGTRIDLRWRDLRPPITD